MTIDIARAARQLSRDHADVMTSRATLLDLLFAIGADVSETAVALDGGDVLAVRVAGPAAPSLEPPLVVVALDPEPPHLSAVQSALGPARWPAPWSSLGGPAVGIAWLAAVQVLAASTSRRPWRALYLRGPATGLAPWCASAAAEWEPDAAVTQLVPARIAAAGLRAEDAAPEPEAADLWRIDLVRARNVWRLPACDHSYALASSAGWAEAMPSLRRLLAAVDQRGAWTLHDLHLYFGGRSHLTAVLRTSERLPASLHGFTLSEVSSGARLMFPVNDALAGLWALAEKLPGVGVDRPLHLHALPDGLRVDVVAPAAGDPVWPERIGALAVQAERSPLTAAPPTARLALALGPDETPGPVPAGLPPRRTDWLVPASPEDALPALARALEAALRAAG